MQDSGRVRRHRSRYRWIWVGASAAVLAATVALVWSDGLKWRAQVVALRVAGQIPDIEWDELLPMLAPSWPHSMERLVGTRNPYTVVRNPLPVEQNATAGRASYLQRCASCHGSEAQGGPGTPALAGREFTRGQSDWAIYRTIRYGIAGTSMPAHALARDETWRLVAFVRAFDSSAQRNPSQNGFGGDDLESAGGGVAMPRAVGARLTYDELRNVRQSGRDWLTYSGAYNGTRHSALDGINRKNVGTLVPQWIHQFDETARKEVAPVVRDGVMFATGTGSVVALDAASGMKLWEFRRPPSVDSPGFPGLQNRGLALLDDKVYVGTSDARLIALSTRDGKVVWNAEVADSKQDRHTITGAPLAVGDMIVVGTTLWRRPDLTRHRGVIAAFDAATGAPRWRFETVPKPGEPGNDSWAGDSWRTGGGAAWVTGTYDAATDTLYWGVGNPSPDYNAVVRAGDNLYTCSVVALRGASGKLQWHFQFSPNDDHDWDATQVPIIADLPGPSGPMKRLLTANRNGFYYVLDRESGRFVTGQPFVQQNWAEGLDRNGRPIRLPRKPDASKGVLVYPSNVGGTNWWSPAMDPARGVFFVPVLERAQVFFPAALNEPQTDANYPASSGRPHYTAVRALEAATGRMLWEHRHEPRLDHAETGGLLSTSGGLVFGADQKTIFALDAANGQRLWSFATGGHIAAAPVTYLAGGRQYVAIAAGVSLIAFALPSQ